MILDLGEDAEMIEKLKTRICTSCQAETDADAIFCSECGAIQAIKPGNINKLSCPNCHKTAAPTDKFCRFCAFKLSKNEIVAAENGKNASDKDNLLEIGSVSDLLTDNRNVSEKSNKGETIQDNQSREKYKFSENKPESEEKSFSANLVSAAMKRYADGYRVARALTGFGATLKMIGLLGGLGFGFLGLIIGQYAATQARNSTFGLTEGAGLMMSSLVTFGIFGAIFALVFWIIGIWLSAQGQVLKAHLDSAVHSSPFLSDLDKAQVMSLPFTGAPQNISNDNLVLNDSDTSLQPNVKASIAYGLSFILSVLWLPAPIYFLMTTPEENRFVRFHSLQSIILNTAFFVIGLFGAFTEILVIYYFAWVSIIVVNLFCSWKAFNNELYKLPVIGDLAQNLLENTNKKSYY